MKEYSPRDPASDRPMEISEHDRRLIPLPGSQPECFAITYQLAVIDRRHLEAPPLLRRLPPVSLTKDRPEAMTAYRDPH